MRDNRLEIHTMVRNPQQHGFFKKGTCQRRNTDNKGGDFEVERDFHGTSEGALILGAPSRVSMQHLARKIK